MPAAFLKRNLLKDAANVILRVSNGKTWSVKFKYEKSRASLQLGWLAFVKDNCLKVGDVCVFVLLEDTKLSFQVEIFKAKSFPQMPGNWSTQQFHVFCTYVFGNRCGKLATCH